MENSNTRTVGELVLDLREAHRTMGVNNPHKALVGQAAFALVYLSQQVEHLKAEREAPKARTSLIVLPEGHA